MAITGTFNNWNIVAVPTAPAWSTLNLIMQDKVSAQPNMFTQQAQILDWQVDWWEASASLPAMQRTMAQPWIAFLAECRGMGAAFLVGDPLVSKPAGALKTIPLVDGVNATRSSTLNIRNLTAGLSRQLLPGDQFQIGYRLHTILNVVNADGAGKASLNIWPRLREAPADGDKLTVHFPKGLFRLADNKRQYSMANTKLIALGLTLTEAL